MDCFYVPSPWLALIPTLAKATAPVPLSLALSRPISRMHTFIHSVSQQVAARATFFWSNCCMWGTGLVLAVVLATGRGRHLLVPVQVTHPWCLSVML